MRGGRLDHYPKTVPAKESDTKEAGIIRTNNAVQQKGRRLQNLVSTTLLFVRRRRNWDVAFAGDRGFRRVKQACMLT